MNQETQKLYEAFQDLEWFHAVGKPIKEKGPLYVKTWIEAGGHLRSGYLEMIGYQEKIALEKKVKGLGRGMGKKWKKGEAELRPLARALVNQKVSPIREKKEWSIQVDMIVDYDLSYALLEREFEELVGPGYFSMKAYWYLQGRLPCGATEEGQLILY